MNKQERAGCRHFRGIQYTTCNAGVQRRTLPMPIPCLPAFSDRYETTCPLFAFKTDEEIEKREHDFEKWWAEFESNLKANICPHCKAPITKKVQVGQCVYAEPCGCRLYQGRLAGAEGGDE